jgi:hypothetical protein
MTNPMTTTTQPAPDEDAQFWKAQCEREILEHCQTRDALTAERLRAEKAERERDEALASERLERNRANGWRSHAATTRAEAVEACARIADQRSAPRDTWGDRYDEGAVACAEIIAEEIRALSPTAPMTKGE